MSIEHRATPPSLPSVASRIDLVRGGWVGLCGFTLSKLRKPCRPGELSKTGVKKQTVKKV